MMSFLMLSFWPLKLPQVLGQHCIDLPDYRGALERKENLTGDYKPEHL